MYACHAVLSRPLVLSAFCILATPCPHEAVAQVASKVEANKQAALPFLGVFAGTVDLRSQTEVPVQLRLAAAPDLDAGGVAGELRLRESSAWIEGRVDPKSGVFEFDVIHPWGIGKGSLRNTSSGPEDARGLVGSLRLRGLEIELELSGTPVVPDQVPRMHEAPTTDHQRTTSRAGLPAQVGEKLDRVLRTAMAKQHVVGMTVAIARDGRLFDVRGFGLQDAASSTPATGSSRYRWASVSKPLTAVAAMHLVRRGQLDLDRDIAELVPEFSGKGAAITSRQLLGHLGGICHYRAAQRPVRAFREGESFRDPIAALEMFSAGPLVAPPGSKYHYSTHGYVLLGAVIQRAGKQPFAEIVQESIANPFGLTTLTPDLNDDHVPHQVVGYQRLQSGAGRPARMVSQPWETVEWKLPAGGFVSTAGDMAMFGVGLLDGSIVQPDELKEMTTRGQTTAGEATNYGLGLAMMAVDGESLIGHSGSQNQTATMLLLDPKRSLSVAVAINTYRANARGFALDVWRHVRDVDAATESNYTLVKLMTGSATGLSVEDQRVAFAGHFGNMKRRAQEGYLLLAGPYGEPKSDPGLRGLLLFDTTDEALVQEMIATDPTVELGVFVPELVRLRGPSTLRRINALDGAMRAELPPDAGPGATGGAYVIGECAATEGLRESMEPLFEAGHVAWFATVGADQESAFFMLSVDTVERAQELLEPITATQGVKLSSWFGTKAVAQLTGLK